MPASPKSSVTHRGVCHAANHYQLIAFVAIAGPTTCIGYATTVHINQGDNNMGRRKPTPRWQGVIGIGDRIAFKMPGESYVTAGDVEAVDDDVVVVSNMACIPKSTREGTQMTFQRGLVVENKSDTWRKESRAKREERKREQAKRYRGGQDEPANDEH